MIRITLLALSLALPCAALAQVQPGSWELTVITQMTDADKPTGPLKKTQCFTEEDANDPSSVLGAGGTCQFSNRREVGNTLSFDVKCSGALPMAGTGSLRTSGDSFTGQLDLGAGSGFRMNTKISGRRLGPC